MALNEWGIDTVLWSRLSDDERADVMAQVQRRQTPPPPPPPRQAPPQPYIPGTSATYDVTPGGKQYAHDVAEFAREHGETATPPPPPPRTPTDTPPARPGQVVWLYVRSLNSFPGNHPYFDSDRAAGVQGYMLKADDPYLVSGAQACHEAGFRVGVWDGPHGEDGATFGRRMVTAAHDAGAEAIAPDMEFESKGGPGSPGWQENADAANAIRSADAGIPVIVTPMPLQDDFNYGAWVGIGASVAVQTYGDQLSDTFDPKATRDRVIANGVPPDRVTVVLPAGSVAAGTQDANSIGLGWWMIFTADDLTPGDRSVPFGASPGGPAGGTPPPPPAMPPPPGAPPSQPGSPQPPPPSGGAPQSDDADIDYPGGELADEFELGLLYDELTPDDQYDYAADEDDADSYELGSGSSAGSGQGVQRL